MGSLPAPLPAEEIFRRVADGVVTLELPDGVGGGVLLSASGLIATNFHLVEGWSTARVRFRDQSSAVAVVCRSYRDVDLAFVQLDPSTLPRAALAQVPLLRDRVPAGRLPAVGETIYVIGHPLGLDFTLTRGIVSAVDRRLDGRRYLQIDAAINPGNSGGPLVDAFGGLIGLTACSRLDAEGLNFAVPIPLVYAKVNAYLEERRQGGLHYCTACGAASRAERYCDQCGALIALVDAIAELDAQPQHAGEPPVEGSGMADAAAMAEADLPADRSVDAAALPGPPSCPACGLATAAGDRYCPHCGASL